MNNNSSEDSFIEYKYFKDVEIEKPPVRLSERRNAVKPYIPPPKKNIKINEDIEIKSSNKFFCCYFFNYK